jgi:hypothetical protein
MRAQDIEEAASDLLHEPNSRTVDVSVKIFWGKTIHVYKSVLNTYNVFVY